MRPKLMALTGLLLFVANFALGLASEQRLFTIPYGKGKDQVAVPPLERSELFGPFEQAPATMRRLRTGDFAILSNRYNEGVILQIFSPEGKLRSYAHIPIPTYNAVIDYEGNVYSVKYAVPADLEEETLLRAFSKDGRPLPVEGIRNQLASLLKEMNLQYLGTPIMCCDGALHIPVNCRSPEETEETIKLITITRWGSVEVSDFSYPIRSPKYGYPICLPGCELGFIEFSSGVDSVTDSGIALLRKSGDLIMRASLEEKDLDVIGLRGLDYPFLNRSEPLVAKSESLILFIHARYKDESAPLGFPMNTNIMVLLDRSGKVRKLGQFDTPVGSHNVWDTDGEGNVYYLAFTKEGAEMRKLVIK